MRRFCAYFILILCAAGVEAFEAGAGKADITGPIGAPLNGYGDRMGRASTGIHDPLWARALYLNDGDTGVFIVNCDLTVITRELRARVLEIAPQVAPKNNIILTATHTHNGQGGMFKQLMPRFVGGRYMPEVLEKTAQGIVQAMNQAYKSRQRATIGYTTITQKDLSKNRRVEGGPIDEQIGIIRVDNADGVPLVLLTNFAAHPTSVPKEDHLSYSADYPGFYYQELEKLAPEGCMAMFLNGTEGNQTIAGPPDAEGAWGRTEAVGRILAQRVHEAVGEIVCEEARLELNAVEAPLPPTLASSLQPGSTFLQTLEINDLLITFFPGEPVVEIGLEMRRLALESGYKAQFSVGLANDYLMYFIPQDFYHQVNYEASMNFFGPDIADWFYRHFLSLASRATPPAGPDAAQLPKTGEQLHQVQEIILEGDGFRRGVQRALAFQGELTVLWQERVVDAIRDGSLLPDTGAWGMLPPFVDPAPLALPLLGMANRPMLEGISKESFDELRGIAEGWGKPFDAVWLLQNAARMTAQSDKSVLFDAPICTNLAVLGDKAVNSALLVGRTMDWRYMEKPVVVEVRPEQGRSYVQVGFTWNTGVFNGMNDAGVVVCVERMKALGDAPAQAPSIETHVAEWLQKYDSVQAVLDAAKLLKGMRGFHVMIAGMEEEGPRAVVVEYGEKIRVREAGETLALLGAEPEGDKVDAEAQSRYSRAQTLLVDMELLDAEALGQVMQDQGLKADGMHNIWNEYTRFSIVFVPERKRILISAPGENHAPGPYELYQLGGAVQP